MAVSAGDRALRTFHPYSSDTEVDMLHPAHLMAVEGTTAGQTLDRVSEFGVFGDLVWVDTQGRAHRDDGKFLSNYELDQIAAHQDQIRYGLQDRKPVDNVLARVALAAPDSPERVARSYFEQRSAAALERPAARRGRMRRAGATVAGWWKEDVDSFDKGLILLGAAAVGAIATVVLTVHHSSPDAPFAYVPTCEDHGLPAYECLVVPSRSQPSLTVPLPRETAPLPVRPADIYLPQALTLQKPGGSGADSIWREVSRTITVRGHHLDERETLAVTKQVMRDNGVRDERAAEHLPIGFKARISQAVRAMVHGFAPQR